MDADERIELLSLDNNDIDERESPLIGAVDQGTGSTRFLIFSALTAKLITYDQIETKLLHPHEGWTEMDAVDILQGTYKCIGKAIENLRQLGYDSKRITAVGITNQRESTVIWDSHTGKPLHNAIIWLDQRTAELSEQMIKESPQGHKESFIEICGLPIHPYFSALKLRWLIDNVPEVKSAIAEKRCLAGTVDSWLIWNLTGGVDNGLHLTDVTNASRTALLNLKTLQWDEELCKFYKVPMELLAKVCSSSEIYGHVKSGDLTGVPISGCLGDQQAALVGQGCFEVGTAKNTYGTGCFVLYNTGTVPVVSKCGLLTTVAYKFGENPACYALEGSVAVAGACVRWMRDNLQIIASSEEVETLAAQVNSSHGVYFVPAFSGLFAPYWHSEARGIICGLTQYTTKAHLARAALEAVCFQTKEVLEAMKEDCGSSLLTLRVDGGMTRNNLLMQIQADLLGADCIRPQNVETTALGAAMAAGMAKGIEVWDKKFQEKYKPPTQIFKPILSEKERNTKSEIWKEAVRRSMNWSNITSRQDSHKESVEEYVKGDSAELAASVSNFKRFLCPVGCFAFGALTVLIAFKLKDSIQKR